MQDPADAWAAFSTYSWTRGLGVRVKMTFKFDQARELDLFDVVDVLLARYSPGDCKGGNCTRFPAPTAAPVLSRPGENGESRPKSHSAHI